MLPGVAAGTGVFGTGFNVGLGAELADALPVGCDVAELVRLADGEDVQAASSTAAPSATHNHATVRSLVVGAENSPPTASPDDVPRSHHAAARRPAKDYQPFTYAASGSRKSATNSHLTPAICGQKVVEMHSSRRPRHLQNCHLD
jgi:hypothetical protein